MKIPATFFLLILTVFFSSCAHKPIAFSGSSPAFGGYLKASALDPEQVKEDQNISEKAVPVMAAASTTNLIEAVPGDDFQPARLFASAISQPKSPRNLNLAPLAAASKLPEPSAKALKDKTRTRNKLVATILAVPPLGMLGLHRFYLGYYLIGVLQLGLTIVGIFFAPPPLLILTFCWVITDFVRIIKEVLEPNKGQYKQRS